MDVKEGGTLGSVADKLGVPTDMGRVSESETVWILMRLCRRAGSFGSMLVANTLFTFSHGPAHIQLIFFSGETFCLLCAILYYKYLPPSKVDATVRHVTAMALGIIVGYFSFGMQFIHVIIQSSVCYTAMLLLPQSVMHIGVFGLALSYLVLLHLYRAFMIPEDVLYSIDVSGPLMIVTEKISSLACSIYDGRQGNKDKLSDLQKRYMISKPPSALEYFSYIFYFQGIVVGPLSFYRDYIAYVNGSDTSKKPEKNGAQNNNDYVASLKLSPFYSVTYKLTIALFWMGFHFTLKPLFPEILNADPEFIQRHSFVYRFWYMIFSMLCCRAKYYVAFSLGDAICNASGLGFNGFDKKGQPRWDRVTNVNVFGIEGATSPKLYIDNWNIQTAVWLRLVCYDRIPVMKKLATFLLSAMWHGCYPGYYFTFIFAAPVTEAARKGRRKIRPYFQSSRSLQIFYDVVTWMGTHIIMSYLVVPFTILHLRPTLAFYTYNMYWCLHIIVAVSFAILPYIPTLKSDTKKQEGTSVITNSNGPDITANGKLRKTRENNKTDSNGLKKD